MAPILPPTDGASVAPYDIERIYRRDLIGLDVNGARCEACGGHMHDHEWADLDVHGVVVHCAFGGDV